MKPVGCKRWFIGMALLTGLLATGCRNAPQVRRNDEVERFKNYLQSQRQDIQEQSAGTWSVARCEWLALSNSLDLRVRRLTLDLQDEQVKLALSQGLPKASAGYSAQERSNDALIGTGNGQPQTTEDRRTQYASVSGMVPVLDWGATYYSWQIARDRRTQERLALRRTVQVLIRDVRVAYVRHAGAMRQQVLAQQAYQAAEQVLRVARSLEKAQLTVKADTALVEAALAQAKLELTLSAQRIRQTHLDLAQLMALPPGVEFAISMALPALPVSPTPQAVRFWEQSALENRPELWSQDLQRHISANNVKREAAAFFPRLDLVGSYNWSSNSQVVNKSYLVGGIQVSHSLLDGGATLWRYSQAKKTLSVEEQRTLLLSLGVLYEVQLRALRLQQALETVDASAALESARRRGMERVISLYKEGLEDEAGAARSLADLTIQSTALDQAQTETLVVWHELEAAALPPWPPATQPATASAAQVAVQPQPVAFPATLPTR